MTSRLAYKLSKELTSNYAGLGKKKKPGVEGRTLLLVEREEKGGKLIRELPDTKKERNVAG